MQTRPTPRRRRFHLVARALSAAIGVMVGLLALVTAPFVGPVAAATSPANCVLPDDGTMGRIDWDASRRPIGVLRAVMLFVDFPDAPASGPADTTFEDVFSPEASDWLARSSYGKLSLQITPLRHWLRMPEPLSAFKPVNGALIEDEARRYTAEAIGLADPEVDFSQTQVVMIVANREATAYPRSSEELHDPAEGFVADGHVLRAIVTLGSSVYTRGYKVLAHETSHTFGLRDYYNQYGSPSDRYVGRWSLMADPVVGGDQFAWDKWRMGWLADTQVACVNAASRADFVLSPIASRGGLKAVILRTGLRTAVVAEFRTRAGLDAGLCSTGVLIYKINSGIDAGRGPIRVADARPRSAGSGTCRRELDDAAFRVGGRWTDTTSGLSISVTYIGSAARIHVVRTKAYTPPVRHERSLTANIVANPDGTATLTAALATPDGFTACTVGQPVSLQEWKAGEWWTLRTANTDSLGAWTYAWAPALGSSYRLVAPERYASTYDCAPAISDTMAIS